MRITPGLGRSLMKPENGFRHGADVVRDKHSVAFCCKREHGVIIQPNQTSCVCCCKINGRLASSQAVNNGYTKIGISLESDLQERASCI